MKARRLALGVDVGASRIRVAALSERDAGKITLDGAGAADIVDGPEHALAAALAQVGVDERRCVAMVRACDARLRCVAFPPMPGREFEHAIRFEGIALFDASGTPGSAEPIAVRSVTLGVTESGHRQTVIAAAPVRKVHELLALLAGAGLRPIWLDHEACALARAGQLPLLDISLERGTLVAMRDGVPIVRNLTFGGSLFTDELARDLGTSYEIAEMRKRSIGLGGACENALDAFARVLVEQLENLRENEGLHPDVVFTCGNGSRLTSLRERIELRAGIRFEPVSLSPHLTSDLPFEVERSGAVDWYGAIAAALPRLESMAWTA